MFKDLTEIADLSREDVHEILARAFELKAGPRAPLTPPPLRGRVVAMIFEKPSLRTKVAFEVAASLLGATPVYLSSDQILASGSHVKGRESIPDIAHNLERFADLIIARVYRHEVIREIADTTERPVINALCDRHHPTQALADLMAVQWHRGTLEGVSVSYVGDGNNVATSLLQVCALAGVNFSIASPDGYEIPAQERAKAEAFARESGASLLFTNDPKNAVRGADVVYTDTFVSMGQEAEVEKRSRVFAPYRVDAALMREASPKALFMHCLPAHRGEEVTAEVFDSDQSIVFDQAECRLHIARSLLIGLLAPEAAG